MDRFCLHTGMTQAPSGFCPVHDTDECLLTLNELITKYKEARETIEKLTTALQREAR